LLQKYRDEAAKIGNLVVGGRLGEYRYYDMDQAMAAALAVAI
jgi:UDP-galactopyranose mutase